MDQEVVIETLVDLQSAALNWWASKRPRRWSELEHVQSPKINCGTPEADALAEACARAVSLRNLVAVGTYTGRASGHDVAFMATGMDGKSVEVRFRTENAVKGIDIPVTVEVVANSDCSRAFKVTYVPFKPDNNSQGRQIAPSGLVFFVDPPDAE